MFRIFKTFSTLSINLMNLILSDKDETKSKNHTKVRKFQFRPKKVLIFEKQSEKSKIQRKKFNKNKIFYNSCSSKEKKFFFVFYQNLNQFHPNEYPFSGSPNFCGSFKFLLTLKAHNFQKKISDFILVSNRLKGRKF